MLSWLKGRGQSDPTLYCDDALLKKDMSGRTVLITGGNSGFGKETAAQLVKQGATVVIACRRVDVGETVAAELNASGEQPAPGITTSSSFYSLPLPPALRQPSLARFTDVPPF